MMPEKDRKNAEQPFPSKGLLENVEYQAQPIIRVLSILLDQARLAANNPDGMRHLLYLYRLENRFKSELNAMKRAEEKNNNKM